MTDTTLLHPGDSFPELTVALPGGRSLQLPGALAGRFGVVLFYRGSWCPYCNAQLSAFQRSLDGLAALGVSVVALSVDGEAATQNLIARHGLQFPVGHSADAGAVAAMTGAFVNPDPRYLQSTGFVLDPAAWYARSSSSGPVIRSRGPRRRASRCAMRSSVSCSRASAASRRGPAPASTRSHSADSGSSRAGISSTTRFTGIMVQSTAPRACGPALRC
jgi:peroxiredoxin